MVHTRPRYLYYLFAPFKLEISNHDIENGLHYIYLLYIIYFMSVYSSNMRVCMCMCMGMGVDVDVHT